MPQVKDLQSLVLSDNNLHIILQMGEGIFLQASALGSSLTPLARRALEFGVWNRVIDSAANSNGQLWPAHEAPSPVGSSAVRKAPGRVKEATNRGESYEHNARSCAHPD